MVKLSSDQVLIYRKGRGNQKTVKNHYLEWRKAQIPPLPYWCDNNDCRLHTEYIKWNGKPINLILDHINGVSGDNRPNNLRLLCPNCNSQQPTNGGGNKGRVEQQDSVFTVLQTDGRKTSHHFLRPDPVIDNHVCGSIDFKFIK